MIGLTRKQAECLRFLEEYIRETGFAPSLRDIAAAMDLRAISGVSRILDGLEERGRIRRPSRLPRSLEIIDQPQEKVIEFLPPDVRAWVIRYADANNILPETVVCERMREWAENEARDVA